MIGKIAFSRKRLAVKLKFKENWSLSECCDEDLVGLACDGDTSAEEVLYRRYFKLVRLRSRDYFLPGADLDDLFQEGLIGFMKAIRDYRADRGSFRAFAELCIRRQIITALKTSTRQKHSILNRAASLDVPIFADNESLTLAEVLPSPDDVESAVIHPEWTEMSILDNADDYLTKHEANVFHYYAQGYDYQSIAKMLGRTVKSIDNAVFKIKLKLRKQLSNRKSSRRR